MDFLASSSTGNIHVSNDCISSRPSKTSPKNLTKLDELASGQSLLAFNLLREIDMQDFFASVTTVCFLIPQPRWRLVSSSFQPGASSTIWARLAFAPLLHPQPSILLLNLHASMRTYRYLMACTSRIPCATGPLL
jgi:hypothetical protein